MRKIFIPLVLLVASCKNEGSTCGDKVKQLIYKVIDADNRSDLKTILSCYADSAVLMPPGKDPITGLKAIDANYRSIFGSSVLQLSTDIDTVILAGNTAIAYGRNSGSIIAKQDSAIKNINDKYVMVLKKTNCKDWKIIRLIWNDN